MQTKDEVFILHLAAVAAFHATRPPSRPAADLSAYPSFPWLPDTFWGDR
jgi:hypothetical protein